MRPTAAAALLPIHGMPPPVALHRPHAPRFSTTPVLAVTPRIFTSRPEAEQGLLEPRHHNLTLATNGFRLMT